MANSFSLLRLPNLARDHVVKLMEFRDQFLFGTLSKRAKRIAKYGICQVSYTFDWRLGIKESCLSIRKTGSSYDLIEINILPIEKKGVLIETVGEYYAYVNDIDETSINLLRFLDELNFFQKSTFKLASNHLTIPSDFIKHFLTTSRILNIKIYELEVVFYNPDNEFYTWLMENCSNVKRLKHLCPTTPDVQINSEVPFPSEYCHLENAPWLTLTHVTGLFKNCRYLSVGNDNTHQMTEKDSNQFVKI